MPKNPRSKQLAVERRVGRYQQYDFRMRKGIGSRLRSHRMKIIPGVTPPLELASDTAERIEDLTYKQDMFRPWMNKYRDVSKRALGVSGSERPFIKVEPRKPGEARVNPPTV